MTVVVVGAGLAGLAAAWELRHAGADVSVLESERRPGGVVVTERRDGFIVEGGPDGFLAGESDVQTLAGELGLRLVDQTVKGSMLWTGKRLESLGEGEAADLLGIQIAADDALSHGFRSLAGGMGEVPEALAERLGAAVRTAQGVAGLAPGRGGQHGWRISITGGSAVEAEAVILAVPAWVASRLLAAAGAPGARELEKGVVYHPSVTVSLAYRAEQLPGTLAGTGFVSAADGGGAVRACSYAWRKYPGRVPAGHALLRAFVGPLDGDPAHVAHTELAQILGVKGPPLWSRAFYWVRGLPRYKPGHASHVAAVRERLGRLAPIDVAGAGFDGAGVSAVVRSGREAARRILRRVLKP